MHRRSAGIGLLVFCLAGAVTLAAKPPAPTPPEWTSVERMHAGYVQAFVESEGFGMARVTPMMALMHKGVLTLDGQALRVGEVQLIGIAKHDPPVVYASAFMAFQHGEAGQDFLPVHMPRHVDEREESILRDLHKGTEVMMQTDAPELRAFGAIRASAECLACHRNKREGDLLGAFVYRLEPAEK